MSKAHTEFDQWVICPKCQSAMVGEVGEECFMCHVEMVATPLFPETSSDRAICEELGLEYKQYTPEEQAILDEFGLS